MIWNKPRSLYLLFLAMGMALLSGCASGQAPSAPPPTASPPGLSAPANQLHPEIVSNCPLPEQARAIRSKLELNWERVPISACYQLSLSLTETGGSFSGTELLTYTNDTGGILFDLVFRLFPNAASIYGGRLQVSSALVNGEKVQPITFLEDQTGLRLPLPQPLPPNQPAQIKLDFTVTVPENFNGQKTYGILNRQSAGPIVSLANWYPILATWENGRWQALPVLPGGDAVTSQSSLYRVTVTAPLEWKIITTGEKIRQKDLPGATLHEFISGPARDFMIVASPAFEQRSLSSGEITITQWGPPSTTAGWDLALNTARSSLEHFNQLFGDYPFNEIDMVAVPLQNASGVEYPGLILIQEKDYTAQDPVQKATFQIVIAHEIAHQWWYSVIGNDVLLHPWQDEALATYSTLDYMEKNAAPIYQVLIRQYNEQVASLDRDYPGEGVGQPVSAFQGKEARYSTVVYIKGALFFAKLRQQIGERAFYQGLRSYYEHYRFQLVEPAQLLDSFQASCGCDLTNFYKEWGVIP